jgi:hypothetical protein
MVLKVVRGKIFQTLELYGRRLPVVPFWNNRKSWTKAFALAMVGRTQPFGRFGGCAHFRLSKNVDYLIDNLCMDILSLLRDQVNKKRVRWEAGSQIGN